MKVRRIVFVRRSVGRLQRSRLDGDSDLCAGETVEGLPLQVQLDVGLFRQKVVSDLHLQRPLRAEQPAYVYRPGKVTARAAAADDGFVARRVLMHTLSRSQLRKLMPLKRSEYRGLVHRYLSFDEEMSRIGNLWPETEPWMDKYK